jgi:transposase
MASGDEGNLFSGLPEHTAPERKPGGKPRLRMAERRQVELRPIALDDLVPLDHRVRMVWSFAEGLDVSALHAAIKAVEGRPGHPPADSRILLALWLFATVEGIGSARELAKLCKEHSAYQWLCGGVSMNACTLADFRVGYGEVLERRLIDSFTALVHAGVASLDRIAQDGMRVRASAGAASFRRPPTLQECRRQVAAAVRELRAELESDPGAASRRQAAARQRAAEDRDRRVREALAVTEALHAQDAEKTRKAAERAAKHAQKDQAGPAQTRRQDERPKEPRASTTDAQARVMKMADGGFRPAYNVQFACDTRSGAVALVSVDNVGSDMGKMAPMNEALAAQYGERPSQHLADGGFARLADIEALTQAGVETFVPVPTPRNAERDRYAPLPKDPPEVAAWRERMKTAQAQVIYKERAATVECAHAHARNHGLTQFVVRGLDAVKAVALWHALTQNMFCSWRLVAA